MARFDRYMLSQLMVLFGFFSLVLVMVYWVNRAVVLFDQLIADGQSALVFLEFTALTLPNVVRVVLPISAFVAAVYVTNRLSSESELVVMQSTGYSGFRLARPVLLFGLIVALLLSLLTHILVPAANRELSKRQDEIAQNVTARFLSEGSFLHPADGVTLYISRITPAGELHDIFLSDSRAAKSAEDSAGATTIYTAKRAVLVADQDKPRLIMFDGMAQMLGGGGGLFTTSFDNFSYDVGALVSDRDEDARNPGQLSTRDLFFPTADVLDNTWADRARLVHEANDRIAKPLLAVVTAMIGFSALLLGGFSRFGVWRQIVLAVVLLVLIKALDNKMADLVRQEAGRWPLLYMPAVAGLMLSGALLWASQRPMLFAWARRKGPWGATTT